MTHPFKAVCLTLLLTLVITGTFAKKGIELTFDPTTGNIKEPIIPRVGLFGGVEWTIQDSHIRSFRIVEKAGNERYIFTQELPKDERRSLHMKLKLYTEGCSWDYCIEWTDNLGRPHKYDPKIAVKPILSGFVELLLLLALIITSITSRILFNKLRRAEAALLLNKTQNGKPFN